MPVRPGLLPVANDAQATGDSGGLVVPSAKNAPRCASLDKLGSWPASIHCLASLGSARSKAWYMCFITTNRSSYDGDGKCSMSEPMVGRKMHTVGKAPTPVM